MATPYFSTDNFVLFLGDCITELMHLQENSIDMVFADPPYFLSDGTITCRNGHMVSVRKEDWDVSKNLKSKMEFHRKWIAACKRVLKPSGTIWISGTYHSIYNCGNELQKQNFRIINDICWFKPNAPPNLSRKCFTASHETLIWAILEPSAKHFFNYDLVKNGNWEKDKLKIPNKQMRSVWYIPASSAKEKKHGKHPTQKPLALLKRIILASTHEDSIVLDPFNGSGTTGIAAYCTGRKYIGIDNKVEYLELTIKRYLEEENKCVLLKQNSN